jgi:hypothetical protein
MAQKQDNVSLKIAAIYAVTGISWILLSDKALEFVGLDQATATRVSIVKGWLYVLLTSILLYWLIRRHTDAIRKAGDLLRERNQELVSMGEQLRQKLAENIQSQQKLFASNQTLKAIFSASPIAIVAIDRDGMVTLWNKAAENCFGWSEAEVTGKPYPLFPEDATLYSHSYFESTLHGEVINDIEDRRLKKNGELIDVSISTAPLSGTGGEIVGIIAMLNDITERKLAAETLWQSEENYRHLLEERVRLRTSELEAANRELEAFSYSVSHDLRAPLRHIYGFNKLLLEEYADRLDANGQYYLNRVSASVERMDQLINVMIQLAQVSLKGIEKAPVNLSSLARSILSELHQMQPERTVAFRISEGLEADGDPSLLRIVMENLLNNAWKYTGKTAEAVIEFGTIERNGEPTYFVRDNGVGFDMNYADKLFSPFQRLHPSEEFEGTGIGLVTVQRIINRHGGKVYADSEVGSGAVFYFTLPGKELEGA